MTGREIRMGLAGIAGDAIPASRTFREKPAGPGAMPEIAGKAGAFVTMISTLP
jgi:hypothetical protein